MYVNDTNASKHCTGYFTVYDLYGDVVDEWGVTTNTSAGETYWDVTIPDHLVNYGTYSYVVNWRPSELGSDMQLCGFRIYYTPPPGFGAYLPAVQRNAP